MKIAVICFTGQGRKSALSLQKNWEMPQDILLYTTGQKNGWDRQKRQAEQIEELKNTPDRERSRFWKSIGEKLAYLVIGGIVTYLFALATGIQL